MLGANRRAQSRVKHALVGEMGAGWGCLSALLGAASLFAVLITIGMVGAGDRWGVIAVLVTVVLLGATVFTARRFAHRPRSWSGWERPVQQAVAHMAPDVPLSETRSSDAPPLIVAAVAAYASGFGIALFSAGALGGAFAVGAIVVGGLVAGGIAAVARDARGSLLTTKSVLLGPLMVGCALGGFMLLAGVALSGGIGEGIGIFLAQTAVVVAVPVLPVAAGFALGQMMKRPWQSAVTPAFTPTSLPPGLEQATHHGRADVVLRRYRIDIDGTALFEEERKILEAAGYQLSTSSKSKPASERPWLRKVVSLLDLLSLTPDDEPQYLEALFVRRTIGAGIATSPRP